MSSSTATATAEAATKNNADKAGSASAAAPAASHQSAPNSLLGGGSILNVLKTGRVVPGCTNTEALTKKHEAFTKGKLHFRFPPEPNGYLHIGHAKSMRLNFGEARANEGKCYLRYDDTNPETEEEEYIDSIKEMALWMGWKPDYVTYSSDYFDQMHEMAIRLIKEGKAYVDHSTSEQIKKQREDRTDSPWRDRPVAESLKLFEHMRQGRYAESEATLRLKMDMKSDNPNMRDFIAYRIKYNAHPRTKDKWCIYPSYDFTHCIVDSLENIDFSLCTLEFETRRESYFWLLQQLDMYRPYVWEFSRLNVTGALLSKRKIIKLVNEKVVRGFDDPRLMTLAGLRRRGFTPAAINRFCELVGITRSMNVIDVKMLENCLREDLDARCPRRFGVLKPVTLKLTNWAELVKTGALPGVSKEGEPQMLKAPNHPARPELGERTMPLTDTLLVDESDFRPTAEDKSFYGLAPGKLVGLKYGGLVTVADKFDTDKDGNVTTIYCTYEPDRVKAGVKPKTNISWLSAKHAMPAEIRCYTYLLNDDKAATEQDFMKYIDANSETVTQGAVEADIAESVAMHDSVQFERFGYFCVDTDTDKGKKKLVMNRVISLREDKEKAAPAVTTKGGKKAPPAPKK